MSKIYATVTMKVVLMDVDGDSFDSDDFGCGLSLRHEDIDTDQSIEVLETDVEITDSK